MRKVSVSVAVAALLLVVTATAVVAVAADSTYDVSVVDAVDTPEETITIEGTEFPVDHIGVVDPGDPITVEVRADDNYDLYLWNQKEKIEYDEEYTDGETTVEIETDDLDTAAIPAGTYLFTLEVRGEGRQAVAPLVVQGYDIDLEYPETVTADDEFEISATVDPKDDLDRPNTIRGVVWNGDDVTELSLEKTDGNDYVTTVSAADIGDGEHELYVAIMDDEEVKSYQTALAVENGASITVEPDDGNGSSGESGGSSGSESSDSTDSDEADGSSDDTDTDDQDETDDGTDDQDESSDDTDTDDQDETDDGTENGDDSVVHPNETTDTSSGDEGDHDDDALGTGGIALITLTMAVLGLGRFARTRSS